MQGPWAAAAQQMRDWSDGIAFLHHMLMSMFGMTDAQAKAEIHRVFGTEAK